MIARIYSSLDTFKGLTFRPGLNIVTAEKSAEATERQTRNGAGKSSILDIVHFLLGGSCPPPKGDPLRDCIFRLAQLNDAEFGMQFDLGGRSVSVERSGAKHGKFVVDPTDSSTWPIQPAVERDTGDLVLRTSQWTEILGAEMFGLTGSPSLKYSPTFRSVFPYFARREPDGGFSTPEMHFSKQSTCDQQLGLSFLMGLDWRISSELQLVRDKKTSFETLKREAGKGVLERFIGNAGEMLSQLTVSQRRSEQLRQQIAEFQVLPEYRELEREASRLARGQSELVNENAIDRERIDQLRMSLDEERAPDTTDLLLMYEQAGAMLPDLVIRRLGEVQAFHATIVQNRRSHLEGEIADATGRIDDRNRRMAEMDRRRVEILRTLSSHGALDQLQLLQEEASRLQAETEDFRRRYNDAKRLESLKSEVALETAQLHRRLILDLEEHRELVEEAVLLFEEFSGALSEHQGHLAIDASDNGPRFHVEVPSGRSVGIKDMQMFCFDLMLITLWTRRGKGPGFLIHDSHLFDGVDGRQIAKAIELGASCANAEGFQYIITLNSDAVPRGEFSSGFDVERFIVPVRLDDRTDTGGLFGFRFG